MSGMEEKRLGVDKPTQRREATLDRARVAVMQLDRICSRVSMAGVEVTGLKIKVSEAVGGEHLVIVTGVADDGTPVVAFHSSVTAEELFVGVMARITNGTLKWKVDEYRT